MIGKLKIPFSQTDENGNALCASVAQSVEQGTENPRVDGSIPSGSTTFADVAHPVERNLAKVEVASSSLVIRSKTKSTISMVLFVFFIRNEARKEQSVLQLF